MNTASRWSLSKEEQSKFIAALTSELAPLRAKLGVSQSDLAYLIGMSRQTYSAIESGRKIMSWATYLALIMFFDYNHVTHQFLRNIEAFPDELVERFNDGMAFVASSDFIAGNGNSKATNEMLQALDEQGLQSLQTTLYVEYARCTGATEDIVKALKR